MNSFLTGGPAEPVKALDPAVPLDGLGNTYPNPSRDEFSSATGSYIKLGNHKNLCSPDKRAYNPLLIGSSPSQTMVNTGTLLNPEYNETARLHLRIDQNGTYSRANGVENTKFGLGFTRKHETSIENPAADDIRERAKMTTLRAEKANRERTEFIDKTLNRNGYNLITGELKSHITQPIVKHGGKRSIIPTTTAETSANSRISLRESEARFFMPHATGHKHEYRQEVLVKGGITKPCASALFQPGKSDFPSDGIEDNFSKSQYPASQPQDKHYSRLDLPEMRIPGKYTPRKQPGNPSGNPELVKNWGSGMDINNKAMRGQF
jgi:hypothetical protein